MVRFLIFEIVFWGSCLYALARGGTPERVLALLYMVAVEATHLAIQSENLRFRNVEVGVLGVDTIHFVACALVAARSTRFWPIWYTAMLGVATLSHIAIIVAPQIIPKVYGNAVGLWSYPMLLTLAAGTWAHQQRLRTAKVDPSWKPFLRR